MKLYVAERIYDYVGFAILGIFSTEEAAQKVCDEDKDGNGHNVEEFDLDAPSVDYLKR